MPAIARKAGKRSVSKAKKVKNVGLKRTKGVCALPSLDFFMSGPPFPLGAMLLLVPVPFGGGHPRVQLGSRRPWCAGDTQSVNAACPH